MSKNEVLIKEDDCNSFPHLLLWFILKESVNNYKIPAIKMTS